MRLSEDLAEFIAGPVLMTIGTRDARNRPMIGRGTGARVWENREGVGLAVSGWLWPETVANLRDNGFVAVTFVRPDTYEAYQFKGRARMRAPEAGELAAGADYVRRVTDALSALDVPAPIIDCWMTDRDLRLADIAVDRVFEQTPGPRAGLVIA